MSRRHLVVSTSLDVRSRSALVAGALATAVAARGDGVEQVDLRELHLPFCDAASCYAHPQVIRLRAAIESAATVTLAVPIYNYDVGGAARNLIALTGGGWTEKIVAFVCAPGGRSSYMSAMGTANSLMLDFRCLIVPRFVYAIRDDFVDDELVNQNIVERVDALADELVRLAHLLVTD